MQYCKGDNNTNDNPDEDDEKLIMQNLKIDNAVLEYDEYDPLSFSGQECDTSASWRKGRKWMASQERG